MVEKNSKPNSSFPVPLSPKSNPKPYVLPKKKPPPSLPKNFYLPLSLSIKGPLAIRGVVLSLAEGRALSLEISPQVRGEITDFYVSKLPILEVLKKLCGRVGAKVVIEEGGVRIEPDLVYEKTYALNFLMLDRQGEASLYVANEIGSGAATSSKDSESMSKIKGTSSMNFWQEIMKNLNMLVPAKEGEAQYTLHKQAGLLVVLATEKDHQKVAAYLEEVQKKASVQVLIEAKIIEVSLHDEFRSGINLQAALNKHLFLGSLYGPLKTLPPFSRTKSPSPETGSLGYAGRDLNFLVDVMKMYGQVRTLSSPRLTVMNNQVALLKVADNEVYFRIEFDKPIYTTKENINVNTPNFVSARGYIQTIPIGLVMLVQPSINLETGEVVLFLRPSISTIKKMEKDPTTEIAGGVTSYVPVTAVREFDSVLKIFSGETVVLGGLMQEKKEHLQTGVPVLKDIPFLKLFFASEKEITVTTELSVFLKATILGGDRDADS